jgi:DNA primase
MAAYRRDDIERVRAATDLVELLSEVTKVKRTGRSVMAVCPFHQEKTPSMSIDAARGLYNCFGCGASGDLFRFVQETQNVDFNDAVELLARRSGITLHRDPGEQRRRSRREALVAATQTALDFYHDRLRQARDAAGARRYLRGRDYDADVVARFGLGYSPPSGDALVSLLRGSKVPEEVMVAAGLAVRSRTGRLFDRFRGRVMFPIFDVRGDPVGFGARLLEGDGPKYLNSPETAIYQKSRLLYGLNWAKSEAVRSGMTIVVEGYTDVIALHRAGLEVAVATCGTALGEGHLDLLRRFGERVVLMFDADEAGQTASLRGFERSVPGDLDLRVALLPPGRDPADVVDDGDLDVIRTAVTESSPLLQFRIEKELERFDLSEPEARGRAVRAAAGLIARHPDRVTRHEYAVFVARRTGVDTEVVAPAVEGEAAEQRRTAEPERRPRRPERLTGQEKAERELLRLMLANHPSLHGIEIDPASFTRPDHAAGFEVLQPVITALDPGQPPDLGSLLGEDEGETAAMLRDLAFVDRPLPDDVGELIRRVQVGALDVQIEALRRRAEELDRAGRPEESSACLQDLITLERRRRELWSPQ